jgi:hypothetical protein
VIVPLLPPIQEMCSGEQSGLHDLGQPVENDHESDGGVHVSTSNLTDSGKERSQCRVPSVRTRERQEKEQRSHAFRFTLLLLLRVPRQTRACRIQLVAAQQSCS